MSNLTLIKMPDNSVIWQTIANYSDTKNATDLIFLYEDKRESHMKNSVSAALALAACALVLSCYSCCCFNRFSVRSRRSQVLLTRALSASNERFRRNAARRTASRNAFGGNGQNNCQDRANNTDQPDVIRRFDLDVESLPSYTIVSGLPTYDDALEQFRKAGIIITHPSIVKIFEEIKSAENTENADNVSISSTCTCGAASTIAGTSSPTPSTTTTATISPVIELSPEQLRILSKKRLSLQIALNSSVRSTNRGGRIDLCREVNRSNLLRSHDIPQIHRSTSSLSNERSIFAQRLSQAQHRGSLA